MARNKAEYSEVIKSRVRNVQLRCEALMKHFDEMEARHVLDSLNCLPQDVGAAIIMAAEWVGTEKNK
jgi:hypothetical protein